MFGVFDGHGAVGHTVSQFVKKKWPETMDRALMNGKKRKRKEKEKKENGNGKWPETMDRALMNSVQCRTHFL